MNKRHLLLLLFPILLFSIESNAQFNFFVGEDAELLKPTVKGFGSITFPSLMMNKSYINKTSHSTFNTFYSMNFGFSWKMWRFADNPALVKNEKGVMEVLPHPDNESYAGGFFSYPKSKLSTGVIRIRPEYGFVTKDKRFSIGTGPLVEFTVAAKTKRKYYKNDNKQEDISKGINDLNLNWFQFGWGASIGSYHFGAFTYYMITPQFKEDLGPSVHAMEVGLYWRILQYNRSKTAPVEKFSQL